MDRARQVWEHDGYIFVVTSSRPSNLRDQGSTGSTVHSVLILETKGTLVTGQTFEWFEKREGYWEEQFTRLA